MKKILLTLLLLTGLRASAFDWTYSTNLFWTITTPTNIFCGTNSTDPARDSYIVIWNKLNADINLMWQRILTATNGGSGGVITNFVLTATNLPAGSAATVTNTGVVGGIAYIQIGVPAGQPGTNFVTVNQFTNVFLSSAQLTTYSSNNITWGTSNFLARVNGLYDWNVSFGTLGGGMAPGTNVDGHLVGSFSGTNSWFTLTNGFTTTNMISVAGVGAGGGLGNAQLFAVDHPELLNRTNSFFWSIHPLQQPARSIRCGHEELCG